MPSIKKVTIPRSKPPAGYVAPNQGRSQANRDIYNSQRWRTTSKQHLRDNPLCVHCEKEGKVIAATITDHIAPINQGGSPWDADNRQSLCLKHHQKKSAKERH